MNAADLPAREAMEFDVVIVGAGPAGLAAAIRLKQLAPETSVVVVEKGSEVGAHILSGAVIDPIALDRLIPEWRNEDTPIKTAVSADRFYLLGASGALRLPNLLLPPLMSNHGNFVVSLGDVCRYLARKAEALGVEIYPGFAAAEVLFENGAVAGIATGDMGLAKDGHHKAGFARGMELRAKYTLLAEGARGSLSKILIERFGLGQGRDPQKFGIGLKELWQVAPERHHAGLVQHTMGWPLDDRTGGGSFLYHFGDNLVAVGFVVHLNYENPYLSPFDEFQRFKTHPLVRDTFAAGKRICYQSVPKLAFAGGTLIGCAAGFMNVPRIKGSHNAMLSGMLAAEHVAAAQQFVDGAFRDSARLIRKAAQPHGAGEANSGEAMIKSDEIRDQHAGFGCSSHGTLTVKLRCSLVAAVKVVQACTADAAPQQVSVCTLVESPRGSNHHKSDSVGGDAPGLVAGEQCKLSFRFRLPFARQLLRLGDLRGGHFGSDLIAGRGSTF